jgi:hypothetical protein
MGNATSGLSPASQPGSAFQVCLQGAFKDASSYTFPQQISYRGDTKLYNTDYPVQPAAIVRPSTSDEVAAAVKCAVANNVKVQPRCGGHSFGNFGTGGVDGALMVDMVKFQKFSMDTNTWQATIGGGTLLGDVTKRLHDNGGRMIAHGTCPQVGVGGHATIGGLGPASRQFGSTLDHIVDMEVVLANGTITRANEKFQPELFWGMRGAGASFGIITEFVFRTQPEPSKMTTYNYNLIVGKDNMIDAFTKWQKYITQPNVDRKLATQVTISTLGMIISGTYFGDGAAFAATGFPAALGNHATGAVKEIQDWLGNVAHWAEDEFLSIVGGISGPFYAKSLDFKQGVTIPDAGIKSLYDYIDKADKGTLAWAIIFDLEGGAINDPAPDATAYGHRDAQFYIQTYVFGIGSLPQTSKNFLNGINDNIKKSLPNAKFGAYAGYVDPQLTDAQQQYWGSNYAKLQSLKRAIDPKDVFSNPQSVKLA